MKLFTKQIEEKLQAQYSMYAEGSGLETQEVAAKLFIGPFTWYLLNQDPQDPDYLWAIVRNGDIVELGSVSKSDLESIKIQGVYKVERDLYFKPIRADKLWEKLNQGEHV